MEIELYKCVDCESTKANQTVVFFIFIHLLYCIVFKFAKKCKCSRVTIKGCLCTKTIKPRDPSNRYKNNYV